MHFPHFFNTYKDSFVYKIMLKSKRRVPYTTMDQALGIIRLIHSLTGGMHQVVYLVGWQYDGHDSKYPSIDLAGPQCASSWSADPRESLRMLMKRARAEFNADVSFHINMNDAYMDSPDWNLFVEKDAIARTADGQLDKGEIWDEDQSYHISHVKEWKSGLARRRILRMLDYLPELRDSRTIHIDAFYAWPSAYEGISIDDDIEGMHSIVDFWHEQGIDVTVEFLASDAHLGYFPFILHDNRDEWDKLRMTPDELCGGSDAWNAEKKQYDYYHRDGWVEHLLGPSRGCRFPEAWGRSLPHDIKGFHLDDMPQLIDEIFTYNVMSRYFNRFVPLRFSQSKDKYSVEFSENVRSSVSLPDRKLTVTENGCLVADGGDVFVTLHTGSALKLLAYSRNGMTRTIELPPQLAGLSSLICHRPLEETEETLPVTDGKITLSLQPHTSAVLFAN